MSLIKHILSLGLLLSYQLAWGDCIGRGCSCSVGATKLAFGIYNTASSVPITSNSTVNVTCGALVAGVLFSYSITLSSGNGRYANRYMSYMGNYNLSYNIYTTSALTSIWGNGTQGTVTVNDSYTLSVLGSTTRQYTAYGSVIALQNLPPGTYNDSIIVTVTY